MIKKILIGLAIVVVALILLTSAEHFLFGTGSSSAGSSSASPGLSGTCQPASHPADVTGDVAYTLTLTNPGSSAVQVSSVAVIFSGANGQEIGSDDPAQQDFPGDAYPISSFNTVLIGAGQSVSVSMETGKISGAAGNWSCSLGTWSS